jgi:hypothetical protein
MSKLQITDNTIYFECPHCNILIMVYTNEIGCEIFRCGIQKTTGEQIPPHTDKKTCDELFNNNSSIIYRYIQIINISFEKILIFS